MERLSTEDRVMLWPDARWPQEIGAIAILDGGVDLAAVRSVIAARLDRVPRFRQLLVTPGWGLGGPLWIDAPDFDLDEHLSVLPVPAPGDEAALLLMVERLRARRLERSRPLWQIAVLPGLAGNRAALFLKVHHAVADGMAGIAMIGALLDPAADAPADPAPPPWRPRPGPSRHELVYDNLRDQLHLIPALGRGLGAAFAAVRGLRDVPVEPATSLNRFIGADRRLALIRTDLAAMKRIAHEHGATVNDVLLAATAGGLRALLISRGEPIDDRAVRADVPVTLRALPDCARARGNMISQLMVPLPVGVADPDERLRRIAADTARRKATAHPSSGTVLRSRLARAAVVTVLQRRPVNVTTTDLVGPPQPLYVAGTRLLEVFPVLPLMANVTLGVGALSYTGRFAIAVTADRDTYPDLDVFVDHARGELTELGQLVDA
jgi:WS/DGAT/MGAT family acyltransferase